MVAPYEFEVERYDEAEKKTETLHGVLFADCYADAADKLDSYFKTELVSMKIFANEESPVYIFEDTNEKMWHGLYKVNFKEWATE